MGSATYEQSHDLVAGLYDYGFRDYTPLVGRWTTPDPIRAGLNWYAYVNEDPIGFVDPLGLNPSDSSQTSGSFTSNERSTASVLVEEYTHPGSYLGAVTSTSAPSLSAPEGYTPALIPGGPEVLTPTLQGPTALNSQNESAPSSGPEVLTPEQIKQKNKQAPKAGKKKVENSNTGKEPPWQPPNTPTTGENAPLPPHATVGTTVRFVIGALARIAHNVFGHE